MFKLNTSYMKNAQEWLKETYPTRSQREKVEKLLIERKEEENSIGIQSFSDNFENNHYLDIKLEKELDLSDFVNLKELLINGQKITDLKISNCSKLDYLNCANNELKSLNLSNLSNLETIICSNNLLTELDLFSQNPEKLGSLYLDNNNFSRIDLSVFSRFTSVIDLYLGTDETERIDKNIYNRFFGSLEDLKNLTALTELNINATDVDSGLEYLPIQNLCAFYCASKKRGSGVEKIKKVLGLSENYAGKKSDSADREKIDRIKIFQDYFQALKKFHERTNLLNLTIERINHKTDSSDLQDLFFQQERLLLWQEQRRSQEFLELADTELKLAKWKISKGFEKLSCREVERLCQVRIKFIRARNLMLSERNIWQNRCQQGPLTQNLIQINTFLPLVGRSN